MIKETLKKFELNNAVLEDFDALMSKHLDQVEELTISKINSRSKLLNIVGLCINVKTLIIEGDERVNVNGIICSICKPELLQNLILNGVRIPSTYSFKKLGNLKMLSLNNILTCSAKTAIDKIVNPEKIEALNFEDVDFGNPPIECIKRFKNLKYLNLVKVKNCQLINLEFLSEMAYLERVNIEKNVIKFSQINNIIKCKFNKQIQLDLPTPKNEPIVNSLEIKENGKVLVTINNNQLKYLTHNLDFCEINDIVVVISNSNIREYINNLKRVKGHITIALKGAYCLSARDANLLKEEFRIKSINIIDFDGILKYEKNRYCYQIEKYIKIRRELEKLLEQINSKDELLNFLQIYKNLGESIVYDEFIEEDLLDYRKENRVKTSNLENGLLKKRCGSRGFAEILKNALACIGIESKIIRGDIIGSDKEAFWNQVKIENKWYNVDLGSDSKRITNSQNKKFKPVYCLISHKAFGKTHTPKISKVEYCPETMDRRIISTFFRRELKIKHYIGNLIGRIKRIFIYNNQKLLTETKGKHEK